jgi:hypothetical protein
MSVSALTSARRGRSIGSLASATALSAKSNAVAIKDFNGL